MKTLIATALLILLSSTVNADGFYQEVVGNTPQASQQVNSDITEFTYTPLYQQVTSSVKFLAAQESIGPRSDFTYTPLYLQVVGPARPLSGIDKLAQTSIANNR